MQLDKERARKNLAEAFEKMHSETDLVMLNEYRKIFKKEVSLFRRSWAAAWFFMNYDRGASGGSFRNNAPSAAHDENALPETESKRLFISVGKNRRLFPKELAAFIVSKTSVSKEDIGTIRILDSYSFVQVRETKADQVIEALNGSLYRGRTLLVNYAKAKE